MRLRRIGLTVLVLATLGCGVPGVPMGLDGRTALDGTCSSGRPDGLTADDLVGTWRVQRRQSASVRRMIRDERPAPFELRADGTVVVTRPGGGRLSGTWEVTRDDGYGHDLELDLPSHPRDAPASRLWVISHRDRFLIYDLLSDPDACYLLWYARRG